MSAHENGREHVDGVNAPRGMSTHPLGAVPQAGDDAGMTDSLRETGGCFGIEGAVGCVSALSPTLSTALHHADTLLANQ